MVRKIKPIETYYNNNRFRSRLEARWAVFFDTLGIKYEYEPEGFKMSDGTLYLPDFYLPESSQLRIFTGCYYYFVHVVGGCERGSNCYCLSPPFPFPLVWRSSFTSFPSSVLVCVRAPAEITYAEPCVTAGCQSMSSSCNS